MTIRLVLTIAAGLLLATPAVAEKPPHAGKGNGASPSIAQGKGSDKGNSPQMANVRINDRDRDTIRRYYGSQFRSGNCPPGLAKKNNGCMPPGQAKKWGVGRPYPRDLAWYDLPRDLYSRLAPVGDGYKYIRSGADILLIATGTMMVLDAIEDLNDMSRGR